jgi:hypothetical protein
MRTLELRISARALDAVKVCPQLCRLYGLDGPFQQQNLNPAITLAYPPVSRNATIR